jgi:hypothetical protein
MRSILTFLLIVLIQTPLWAQKTDEYHLDETYPIKSGATVMLESNDADVTIVGSSRSDVRVKVDYKLEVRGMTFGDREGFRMEIRQSSDGLQIQERSGQGGMTGFVGSMKEEYQILLEVPRSVSLKIKGDDDDYEISGIEGNLALRAEDGDIRIRDSRNAVAKIMADDAYISISDGMGKLRIRSEDGDVEIRNGDYEAIDLRVDDGDVELETRLHSAGKYQLESSDGDFEISILSGGGDIWLKHDDGSLVTNGSFEIREHSDHNKRLFLPGGSAQVRIKSDDGDVTLNTM